MTTTTKRTTEKTPAKKVKEEKSNKETRSSIRIFWEDYLKGEQGEILDMKAVFG